MTGRTVGSDIASLRTNAALVDLGERLLGAYAETGDVRCDRAVSAALERLAERLAERAAPPGGAQCEDISPAPSLTAIEDSIFDLAACSGLAAELQFVRARLSELSGGGDVAGVETDLERLGTALQGLVQAGGPRSRGAHEIAQARRHLLRHATAVQRSRVG